MTEQRSNMSDLKRQLFESGGLLQLLTRSSDVILAVVVVSIIGIMIVPLPTMVLDLLLATNLTMAVTLLMISVFVPNALSLASFPSILLITTLFRLSLNVSSTRLILGRGNAGEVIRSFGDFVVEGNFVVGFVVFVVITLIQFIVIAKGAERVSEVAARFTLDALPGKQMSIDADLRAGIIDVNEAKRKREYLGKESQFYGAMDGAMKFVKGDAIAGIVISIVNIAAGLGIGVAQMNLSFAAAARKYTLLTVGDGLVSQIPSLVIATTAGIITTRVASNSEEGKGSPLGAEIGQQLLAQPKALALSGVVFGILGLVPGLPTFPFLVMSGLALAFYFSLRKSAAATAGRNPEARVADDGSGRPISERDEQKRLPVSQPVILETSSQITPLVDVNLDPRFLQELIPEMREWMFQDMGVHFPGVRVRGDAAHLEDNSYTVHINEVPTATGTVRLGHVFAATSPEEMRRMGVEGFPAPHPSLRQSGVWIEAASSEVAQEAAIQVMQPDEYMAVHLAQILKANVDQLLGIQDVQNMLDLLEQQGYETLVTTVVPKLVTVQRLTDVLKRLLQEDISIKNMRRILEALAHWAPYESDPVYLTEYARMGLKQYIAYKVTAGRPLLAAYVLDPEIEQAIEGGIRQSASGSSLSLDPKASQAVIEGFRRVLTGPRSETAVVLTQMEVRYFLKRLLQVEFPQVTVLSFQELPSELQIQPIGRIELNQGLIGAGEVGS